MTEAVAPGQGAFVDTPGNGRGATDEDRGGSGEETAAAELAGQRSLP